MQYKKISSEESYRYFKKLSKKESQLPYKLIELSIDNLETILFDIFYSLQNEEQLTPQEVTELQDAYKNASVAHNKTGVTRKGSKLPYIHHPLAVTIYAWHLAKILDYEKINIKNLLLGAIYHDTIEDTAIFNTKDTGVQFSKIGKKHGEYLTKVLYYVTKIPLNIDPALKKLKRHFKKNHLLMFNNDHIPLESRVIKIADRIMNLADLKYSPLEFKIKITKFTEKHFAPVLTGMPARIQAIFWSHLVNVKDKYGLK